MAKKALLLGLILLIVASIYAKYSDDFIIGTYSHTNYHSTDCTGQIASLLQEAHFNLSAASESTISTFDQHNIDVWLWNENFMKATWASYYKYQVNYTTYTQNPEDINAPLEELFYYTDYDDTVDIDSTSNNRIRTCFGSIGEKLLENFIKDIV